MVTFPEFAVHKTVPLKFSGVDLKFKTTHALFSYHHVDDGTLLLLKTLAQQKIVPDTGRVLDAGCGYGPLGIALKKTHPGLQVSARDRLALAAAFTAENARINQVDLDTAPGLLLDQGDLVWDLIVSNIPAKAGEPVLADFVLRSASRITAQGIVAVVVVETLADFLRGLLDTAQIPIRYEETGPGYRVFHWGHRREATPLAASPFPTAYRRGLMGEVKTFYGLPGFDTADYRLELTVPLLDDFSSRGDLLLWEPVQGHLAAWMGEQLSVGARLHLAGNDLLALRAAQLNSSTTEPMSHCVPSIDALDLGTGSLGGAIVQIHSEPEIPWVEQTRDTLLRLLAPGAPVIINGTSTDLTRFLERHKGLRKLRDVREKGWRAVILERQSQV